MASASTWGETKIIFRIALRNLRASKAKTAIIGAIVLLGTVVAVAGSSLVESVDKNMTSSIQGSLGGHLQVYDLHSKDDLELYGGMRGESLLQPMEDFARVKEVLGKLPEVKSVVPMGIDTALVAVGNPFDVALERLRAEARKLEAGDRDPEVERRYQARKAHVRRMTELLREELTAARAIADDTLLRDRARESAELTRAASPEFWAGFDRDRLGNLEFMENRIAPQAMDGGFTFVRYVGTDLDAFMEAFDRTEVVEGARVPRGQRGILLGKWYAEEYLKLKTARRLDKVKDALELQGRKIAGDEELSRWVKENGSQLRDVMLQLDPVQAEEAAARLGRALKSEEKELPKLLGQLFATTDQDFAAKYRIFYDELAPLLQLYTVRVGDTITIKAVSKSGYFSSVNVRVYGFVQFRGLEKSGLAGIMSLLDLQSWRDLYGYMTREKAAEIQALKQASGAKSVDRANAEAELFGGGDGGGGGGAAPSRGGRIDMDAVLGSIARPAKGPERAAQPYSQDELDRGVALNAAVLLKDSKRIRAGLAAVQRASDEAKLGLKVVDWQKASGLIGQAVTLFRVVLYTAVFIIFAIALVIINNAMVMATLQRVKEIGTMRAIGAQKSFVRRMLLVETAAVSLLFGLLGAATGAAVVWLIRVTGGIAARNDQLYFFFSGPALLPTLGTTSVLVSLAIVLVVSILSGFYPALIAMRVSPVEAMASDE
jgi:ABC-type lipoprotein release transport system permease subunit